MNSINEWHKQDEPELKPEKAPKPKPKIQFDKESADAWKKELQKFLDWHPLPETGLDFYDAVSVFEKHLVDFAYNKRKLNKEKSAEYLRLGRTTFAHKFKFYGLRDNRVRKTKK